MSTPNLYEGSLDNTIILQGDIFPEIDFSIPVSPIKSVKKQDESSISPIDEPSMKPISREEFLTISQNSSIIESRLMSVISHTCDIDDGEYIIVSPIFSVEEFILNYPKNSQSNIALMKSRKGIYDKFYLSLLELSGGATFEGYINLKIVNIISSSFLSPNNKIASLSHWGRHVLNSQLMWLYGRPVVDWKKN